MNVINKYVFKSLKLNKTRTIVTIIGIMLSCALITALSGLITSFHQSVIDMAIDNYGNRHVTFLNVPTNELDNIINNKNVESYYLNESLGYSILENSKNDYKPYLNVIAYDETSLNSLKEDLIKGNLPKNENELAISEHIRYDALVEYKIGDKVTLNIGKRMSEGYELTQDNPFSEDVKEEIITEFTKEYTIVGIIKRQNEEGYSSPGYNVITKMNKVNDNLEVSVLYKNVKNYKKTTKEILNINKKDNQYGVTYNIDLIRAQGSGFSDNTMKTIYTMGAILSIIIVLTSTFCIRNSFAISVQEKTKTYGMFASIGATPKQIKKSVLFEGAILGIIGIILGILFGILASYILVLISNYLLGASVSSLLNFNVSIYGILISALLSIVTVYLSCIGSARHASKTSEIETIKLSNDIKYKKIKNSKLINRLFGVTGNVSYKNMQRNKKKFRVTIVSITICILTFITMSTFINLGFITLNDTYKDIEFNIIVDQLNNQGTQMHADSVSDIVKLNDIKKYTYLRSAHLDEETLENTSVFVASVGKEEYTRYIKKLGLNYNDVFDKALVYNQHIIDIDTGLYTDELYFKENITSVNLSSYVESNTKNIKLDAKIIKTLPMGFELTYMDSPIIILSDETFDKIFKEFYTDYGDYINHELFIESSSAENLNKELIEYRLENNNKIIVTNLEELSNQMQNMILLVSILLYGFISVITLIGVTNIFNTITTSMNLRRREFAIMQSIGMSKKELNNMILFESLLYGLKSLMYGLPLGILGSFLMYKATTISPTTGEIIRSYELPIGSILISIIFTFIIIILIMKLSLSKINKQNIIETIRNENI